MPPTYWVSFKKWSTQMVSQGERDLSETKVFLSCYRNFTSPSKLLKKWINDLKIAKKNEEESRRLVEFLFIWISEEWNNDFKGKLRTKFYQSVLDFLPCMKNEIKLLIIRMTGSRRLGFKKMKEIESHLQSLKSSSSSTTNNTTGSIAINNITSPSKKEMIESVSSTKERRPLVSMSSFRGLAVELNQLSAGPEDSSSNPPSPSNSRKEYFIAKSPSQSHWSRTFNFKTESLGEAIHFDWISSFKRISGRHFIEKIGFGSSINRGSPMLASPGKTKRSPLEEIVTKFNQLSHWVTMTILTFDSKQELIIEEMIRLAKYLEQKGNFDSCISIISGLNHFSVQRLKSAWNHVSEKDHSDFVFLESLINPTSNFKNYHECMNGKKGMLVVPFVGCIMRDFTFLNENEVRKGEEVNLHCLKLVQKVLDPIYEFHSRAASYSTSISPSEIKSILDWLLNEMMSHPHVEDEELYQLSLKSEPPSFSFNSKCTEDDNSASSYIDRRFSFSESDSESVCSNQSDGSKSKSRRSSRSYTISPIKRDSTVSESIARTRGSINSNSPGRIRKFMSSSTTAKKRMLRSGSFSSYSENMEEKVANLFQRVQFNERKGRILIGDESFCMMRMTSYIRSIVEVLLPVINESNLPSSEMEKLKRKSNDSILYSFWRQKGFQDAFYFKGKLPTESIEESLVQSLIFCRFLGWNRVKLVESKIEKDNFFLHLVKPKRSKKDKSTNSSNHQCSSFAGYISGWISLHLGRKAIVCEVSCSKDHPDRPCTFICASESKIDTLVSKMAKKFDLDSSKIVTRIETQEWASKGKGSAQGFLSFVEEGKFDSRPEIVKMGSLNNIQTDLNKENVLPAKNNSTVKELQRVCSEAEKRLFGDRIEKNGKLFFEKRPNDLYLFVRSGSLTDAVDYFQKFISIPNEKRDELKYTLNFELGKYLGSEDVKSFSLKGALSADERVGFICKNMRQIGFGSTKIHPSSQLVSVNNSPILSDNIMKQNHPFVRVEVSFGMENSTVGGATKNGTKQHNNHQCCSFTAGFIGGWMSEALETPLSSVEVGCVSLGYNCCTFLVSSPDTIQDKIERFILETGSIPSNAN